MRLVEDDEAGAAEGEHEGRSEALHDVLAVHSVRHEGHGPGVSVLVGGAANAGGFHYHVVNNTTCYKEV